MKKLLIILLISSAMTSNSNAQSMAPDSTRDFLLLFRNTSGDGKYLVTPEDMQRAMPKWQNWIGGIAKSGKLVATHPIDYNGKIISRKTLTDSPYLVKKELVVGYLILKATTMEEAISISKTCPIITEYNGSVEIRALVPFPQP